MARVFFLLGVLCVCVCVLLISTCVFTVVFFFSFFCSGFSSIRFSTVVIDEATQATEAAALVPIVRGCKQLVLVGDQNQVRYRMSDGPR